MQPFTRFAPDERTEPPQTNQPDPSVVPGPFTACGRGALAANESGINNVAVGDSALFMSTASGNIALGTGAGSSVTTATNVTCIGAPGANVDFSCFIGRIYDNVQPIVGTGPDSVAITSAGRLGRGNVSSRRFKHDIQPMEKASEVLYALKPVSFRYNKEYDATQTLTFDPMAEEVADVYPDLVGRNNKGEPESVRYEQVNAMLLNESTARTRNSKNRLTFSRRNSTSRQRKSRR
jgi:hypothetical protein